MSKFSLPTSKDKREKQGSPSDIDITALEAFAAGAKEKDLASGEPEQRPWNKFDPTETPRHSVSMRLNNYHLEMLRYLSEKTDNSQHKILRKHLIPVIEQLAEAYFDIKSG